MSRQQVIWNRIQKDDVMRWGKNIESYKTCHTICVNTTTSWLCVIVKQQVLRMQRVPSFSFTGLRIVRFNSKGVRSKKRKIKIKIKIWDSNFLILVNCRCVEVAETLSSYSITKIINLELLGLYKFKMLCQWKKQEQKVKNKKYIVWKKWSYYVLINLRRI